MKMKPLSASMLSALLLTASSGLFADNRFDTQGGAADAIGTFGSGSVTVHHNLLAAERDEIIGMINELEVDLGTEVERLETLLEVTRDALAGDIDAVEAKTNAAQVSADNAQASADQALTHAQTLFNQLEELEQDVVATQLAVKYAQAAADSAQGTADQARAEAAVAQASADAANALAELAREEAANAQQTGNTARSEAGAAQDTADTALSSANAARNEASAAQRTADTALNHANTARSEAEAAQNTANTALSRANTARDEAAKAQDTADAAEILAREGIADALKAFNEAKDAQKAAEAAQRRADEAYQLAQEAYAIGVPSGAYAYFHQTTCPSGWVHANGLNNTVDLRGEFIRVWDAGRGKDRHRTLGSFQSFTTFLSHPVRGTGHGFTPTGNFLGYGSMSTPISFMVTDDARNWADGDTNSPDYGREELINDWTMNETRPDNIALLACMKR